MFNIVCVLLCGILIGIIIGFILARPVIRQRMYEVETHWRDKAVKLHDEWRSFHRAELDKWQAKTAALVNKTYYDTVEERDRAWQKKFNGTKSKPKLPSN
jgi:uncharacterized membrane-anchored protein YhcB (DUF1043 family)